MRYVKKKKSIYNVSDFELHSTCVEVSESSY